MTIRCATSSAAACRPGCSTTSPPAISGVERPGGLGKQMDRGVEARAPGDGGAGEAVRRLLLRVGVPRAAALWFLVVGLPAVACQAVLMPPFQNPDEPNHLLRADQVSRGGLLPDPRAAIDGGLTEPNIGRAAEALLPLKFHPERKAGPLLPAATALHWSAPQPQGFANTAIYPPVFYLPAALATALARALDLSIVHSLQLARLASGAASVALGAGGDRTCRDRGAVSVRGALPAGDAGADGVGLARRAGHRLRGAGGGTGGIGDPQRAPPAPARLRGVCPGVAAAGGGPPSPRAARPGAAGRPRDAAARASRRRGGGLERVPRLDGLRVAHGTGRFPVGRGHPGPLLHPDPAVPALPAATLECVRGCALADPGAAGAGATRRFSDRVARRERRGGGRAVLRVARQPIRSRAEPFSCSQAIASVRCACRPAPRTACRGSCGANARLRGRRRNPARTPAPSRAAS